jgi:hypothetical protein
LIEPTVNKIATNILKISLLGFGFLKLYFKAIWNPRTIKIDPKREVITNFNFPYKALPIKKPKKNAENSSISWISGSSDPINYSIVSKNE